jgi:hypothetical protein
VYQLSINNFSRNRLFVKYALEDLAEMLKLKILVFERIDNSNGLKHPKCAPEHDDPHFDAKSSRSLRVYEPKNIYNLQLNDYVYLCANESPTGSHTFSWLMYKGKQHLIDTTVLSFENQDKYFVCVQHQPFFYAHQAVVLDRAYLFRCFSHECLLSNVCIFLYLRFLGECAVQTLVSLNELKFSNLVQTRNVKEMCSYLNRLWGQRHFNYQYYVNFNFLASNKFKKPVIIILTFI